MVIILSAMHKLLLTAFFLLLTSPLFAQKETDTLLNKLPMVNGRLVYADSIAVKGRNKAALDSAAKKWFYSYFKQYCADTLTKDQDAGSSILNQGALIFRMSPNALGLVKYDYYLIVTLKINCTNEGYSYKIFHIYFAPKSKLFRAVGYYQTSPDYLIGLLNKKHLGLEPALDMGRNKIRDYLTHTNDAIQACIASLNKSMTN